MGRQLKPRLLSRTVLVIGLLGAMLPSGPALAQEPEPPIDPAVDARARELFENGQLLFQEGRYEDAIVAWREAWVLSGRPVLLFNIASAQERLGQWREALDTLNRYRAFARPDERESLDRRIANLERYLTDQRDAAANREGAQPEQGDAGGGGSDRASVPWGAVALWTVGAGGIVTGTIFGLRASSARSDARSLCVDTDTGLLCPSTAQPSLQRDKTSALVADISFVAGGLAVAGGVLVVALDAPGGLSWGLGPGRLSLSGSF